MSSKLDIGAGDDPVPGADTLDRLECFNPDIHHDLTDLPLPIEDNQYSRIYLKDVLEHLPTDPEYLDCLFQELERILESGGSIYIRVPYYTSSAGAGDIQHTRTGYSHQFHLDYVDTDLQVTEKHIKFRDGWFGQVLEKFANRHPIFYERTLGLSHVFPGVNLELEVRHT